MKKALIIAATVAALGAGFTGATTAPAEAGHFKFHWKKHFHFNYHGSCKVKYYHPHYGWTIKWVPCHGGW